MAIQTTLEFAHAFLATSDYQGSHFDYQCSHIDYQGGHDNYWPPMTTPNLVKMTTFSFQCVSLFSYIKLTWKFHFSHMKVSNHLSPNCLFKILCGLPRKQTSKVRITGLCEEKNTWPVVSHRKRLVLRHLIFMSRRHHLSKANAFNYIHLILMRVFLQCPRRGIVLTWFQGLSDRRCR